MSSTPTNIWNSGFWGSLFSNADEGVDALGRNTASNITAISNAAALNRYVKDSGSLPTIKIATNDTYVLIVAVLIVMVIGLSIIIK